MEDSTAQTTPVDQHGAAQALTPAAPTDLTLQLTRLGLNAPDLGSAMLPVLEATP